MISLHYYIDFFFDNSKKYVNSKILLNIYNIKYQYIVLNTVDDQFKTILNTFMED